MTKSHSYSLSFTLALSISVLAINCGCSRAANPTNPASISASSVVGMTQAELKTYILKETQPGGKLDFFTPIKGHETDGRQIRPGVYATGLEFALYNWGSSVKDLGVKTVEEAYTIYSEVKGKEVTTRDQDTIKLGFNKALDK